VSAGDTICVEIGSLQVDSSRGLMLSRPGVTGLAVTDQPQLGIVTYDGAQADVGPFRIPAVAMIGPIGVAPEGEAVSTFRGGEHGGNMAVLLIGVGSRVFLTAFAWWEALQALPIALFRARAGERGSVGHRLPQLYGYYLDGKRFDLGRRPGFLRAGGKVGRTELG
jgi:hypothetical protein